AMSGAIFSVVELLKLRHSVFRVAFFRQGDELCAGESNQAHTSLLIDLDRLNQEDRGYSTQLVQSMNKTRQFDLEKSALVRSIVLMAGDDFACVSLASHHVVFDGSSIPIVYRELQAILKAFRSGDPVSLPPLNIEYFDFAQW